MFVQAAHYHEGRIRPLRMFVWHDMEWGESVHTAEDCAREFRTTSTPKSAHICADTDSVVECVHEDDTAFAAPGGNSDGYQIELHGFARQTAAQWLDAPSKAAITNAAKFIAPKANRLHIPSRFLTLAQVKDGVSKGHTTHAMITKAFHLSTHSDPGVYFPEDFALQAVHDAAVSLHPAPPAPIVPTKPVNGVPAFPRESGDDMQIQRGDRGREVVAVQTRMRQRGYNVTVDGVFGDQLYGAVLSFEKEKHLQALPGVVGPGVWNALWTLPVT